MDTRILNNFEVFNKGNANNSEIAIVSGIYHFQISKGFNVPIAVALEYSRARINISKARNKYSLFTCFIVLSSDTPALVSLLLRNKTVLNPEKNKKPVPTISPKIE